MLLYMPQVRAGQQVIIDWRIGQHDDMTILRGTGLLFRWSDSIEHNLIEMSDPLSVRDCSFVRENNIGKVK